MSELRERRKVRVGRVVSNKMDKTVVVAVERRIQHRLYGKTLKRITKFKAHDEQNNVQTGDLVRIVETRPLSATKRWRVAEVITASQLPDIAPLDASIAEVRDLENEEAAAKAELIAAQTATSSQDEEQEVHEAFSPEVVEEPASQVLEEAPPKRKRTVKAKAEPVQDDAPALDVADQDTQIDDSISEEEVEAVEETEEGKTS